MKQLFIVFGIILLISSCNTDQSKNIVKKVNSNELSFDISIVDTLIREKLNIVDSITFHKYIYQNPVILGIDYGPPNLYHDGFWIKKYADSLLTNLIYTGFSKSNFYVIPCKLLKNAILVIRIYPAYNLYEHIALYLIKTDVKSNYLSTVLLAEKIKAEGLASIDLITKSILIDSTIIEQTTVSKSSITDLPGPNGEITSFYDTTITYYKLKNGYFDRYRRKVIWNAE